jgi:hypothetical protein
MEPEGSVPCSQDPQKGPYPDQDESSPHLSMVFPKDPFYYYPPIYA